jgi:2-amino-4-hydroxy-6-hydroxymethyldihydropteridine diphosphokinase
VTTAYLALGANLGDRLAALRRACALLEEHPDIAIEARSAIYETESVEAGGQGDFLNAALRIRTGLSARDLLRVTRGIEETLGRPQPPRHGARLIDIDILLFGEEKIDLPDLQVPHPRMWRRAFVLRPLSDVLPNGWVREANENWT